MSKSNAVFSEDPTIECRIVRIGPEKASELLLHNVYEKQRPRQEAAVKYYADMMLRGEWLPGTEITAVQKDGHELYLNGQHRLAAIEISGTEQVFTLVLHHRSDELFIKRLYYHLDNNIVRSVKVAYTVLDVAENIGVANTTVARAGAALRVMNAGFSNGGQFKLSRDQLLSLLYNWAPEIALWSKTVGDSKFSSRVSTSPVLAVGLVTMRHECDRAIDFWGRVARQSNLIEGTPEYLLMRFIDKENVSRHGVSVYCRKVAAAWNAFIEERTISQLKVVYPSRPIVLAATPYDGKEQDDE